MDAACNIDQVEEDCSGKTRPDLNSRFNENVKDNQEKRNSLAGSENELTAAAYEEEPEKQKDKALGANGIEVAIQADDYEIERGSSQLPQRKRFVPLRFSDYRVFASNVKEEEEEEEEDSSFTPTVSSSPKVSSPAKHSKGKRSRGRPRKYPDNDGQPETLPVCSDNGRENIKKEIVKAPNGFKCNICERVFSLRGNAKAHLITHSEDKPFSCDFSGCGKKLRSKESLRRHKLSHMGIKMFECTECKKKFSCNLSLQEHMALHTGEKPLTCEICGRKFRQIAVLKRHLSTHSTSKPYACSLCDRRFALKVYVQSHMKTHTGEKPFTCDICNKSFAHASDLNRHKIIHSGKKPYKCSICSMRYSDPSSRRRHEREHQNKQQYICHMCNQRFPRTGQLRVHILKEHSGEPASLPYRVEIGLKPTPVRNSTWAETESDSAKAGDSLPALDSTMATPQGADPQGISQGNDEPFMNIVQPQTVQLVLENSAVNQVGCLVPEGIVIQESDSEGDKPYVDLQPPSYTYRLVNSDEQNQVYELHVEGSQFSLQDISNAVKLDLSELKMKDRTVTFIQDSDSYTVMNESDIQNALKIEEDPTAVGSDSAVSSVSVGSDEMVTLKAGTSQSQDDTIVIVKDHDNVCDVPKAVKTNQNADLTFEHQEAALCLNDDDSLSVADIKTVKSIENIVVEKSLSLSSPSALDSDFISHPDLNSQEYYNWLAAFSEECKGIQLPLDKSTFLKISQVQKTLSDYMAIPSGVISDKNNFKILMTIAQDLSTITSSHLSFMYSNLSQ